MPRERVELPTITPNIHKKLICLHSEDAFVDAESTKIRRLSRWLRSPALAGRVLRVLVHRLKYPAEPYTDEELYVLLLLSLAELV